MMSIIARGNNVWWYVLVCYNVRRLNQKARMDCLGDATRTSRVVPSLGWLFRYGGNIGGSVTWAATMDNSFIYPQKFDNS